eukprot:754949-Hanusia_phi.AAC.2
MIRRGRCINSVRASLQNPPPPLASLSPHVLIPENGGRQQVLWTANDSEPRAQGPRPRRARPGPDRRPVTVPYRTPAARAPGSPGGRA